MACFRDKESENYEELATVFVQTCKAFNVKKILLNERYELAKKVGATGVHLTSKQFDKIKDAKKDALFVVISCHNLNDIKKAQNAHTNAVTFSPIFETPNKGEAKGLEVLEEAVELYDIDIIALGGILSLEQIDQIKLTKASGYASIRYFI